MHPQRATLSPACAPAIPPPQTRCRAGSVWKTLLRRRGTWSGAPASAVGCMRPGATHRRQQRGSLSAGRRTGVGRRVHGGEQAERRVARDGGRIAALGQRDAAGIVLQQPRDALQGLPQGCRIRAAPLLIRHPRPHTPSSSSLILFFLTARSVSRSHSAATSCPDQSPADETAGARRQMHTSACFVAQDPATGAAHSARAAGPGRRGAHLRRRQVDLVQQQPGAAAQRAHERALREREREAALSHRRGALRRGQLTGEAPPVVPAAARRALPYGRRALA